MGKQAIYGGVARRSIGVFSPWVVSATAYALGAVTSGMATLGMTLLGYADAPPLSAAELVQIVQTRTVPQDALTVFLVAQGLAILVQAMWIIPRGKHGFLAPVASLVMGWVVATSAAPFVTDPAILLALTAAVQILVLAALIGRTPPRH